MDSENENIENVDSTEEIEDKNTTEEKSDNFFKKLGYVIAAVLLIVGVAYYVTMPNVLEKAAETCTTYFDLGFSLDDDGKSAYMDGRGEDEGYLYTMSTDDQICILDELDAPTSVYSRISNTNSLMGVQEAEWDNIKIRWTYHPDNGLDVSIDLD